MSHLKCLHVLSSAVVIIYVLTLPIYMCYDQYLCKFMPIFRVNLTANFDKSEIK